jgi:DNA polymerase III epsilon subunit family exonuclease
VGNFTIIDIETTGLSKHSDKITEIAAARVRDGKVVDSFQTLVNPEMHIPSFITKLTGITNSMVADAPKIHEVLEGFVSFLGKDTFVAHNATFDFGFLAHNLQKHHGHELCNEKLCTRKLANRLVPELPRKRLGDLCEHFNVENEAAHRAMGDVNATVKVFSNMLGKLEAQGISKVSEIIAFERAPRRR